MNLQVNFIKISLWVLFSVKSVLGVFLRRLFAYILRQKWSGKSTFVFLGTP